MVSVVIPTCNRREMLVHAVQSVLHQTFPDWELLIVDDGSIDDSWKVVEQFRDRRIHYLYQKHRGVSAARNLGACLAHFPWICFLDSDDYWQPRKLQRQIEELEQHPQYKIIYTDEIWVRHGRRVNPKNIHRKYSGWIYHRCLPLCIISPSSVLLHRTVLEKNGFFDEALPVCEDYELWLRVSSKRPILFLEEKLIVKRGGHPDQLSRSLWGMDRYRVNALIKTYRSSMLTIQQKLWTAREIVKKSAILARGFENRGKLEEAERYRHIAVEWLARS